MVAVSYKPGRPRAAERVEHSTNFIEHDNQLLDVLLRQSLKP